METPSTEHMASLAKASYVMGQKSVKKNKRLQETQDTIKHTNYIINPKYSNHEISVFQHKKDPKNIVISMRGTKVDGRTGKKDIINDMAIATGRAGHEKTFKRRKQKTNKILKELKPNSLHMTSHSLGGATQNYTIANSNILKKYINDGNTFSAKTFNTAHHPVFDNDIKVGKKYGKTLNKKVKHFRTKNDVVSIGLKTNNPFGEVVEKDEKYEPKKNSGLFNTIIKHSKLGKIKNFTDATLHAHNIDHFT